MRKKDILLIIIALLIIIICTLALLINLKKSDKDDLIIEPEIGDTLVEVRNRNIYYMVQNCVDKFYKYYSAMYENIDEDNLEKTYKLLDEKYINYKNITLTNINTVLPEIKSSVVNITNMYASKQNEEITIYIVEGILREEISKLNSDFRIMIQIDSKNQTFSVLLDDYIVDKHNNLKVGDKFNVESLNLIKTNRYNLYVLEEITDEDYVVDLVNRYKEEALYNQELAYNKLDVEYSSIKFETIEKFNEYVKENEEKINNIKLEKYQKSEDNKYYIQYVCVDENGSYYIFRETGIMKYTLILDAYTIDLPEFLEKYNNALTVDKVGYNIEKCLNAINNKDYAYIYNKLDFEFKAINYPLLKNLEETIKEKLFDRNSVKSLKSYREGEIYIFQLIITDYNNTKEQPMTIIMKLKEGTDFIMSFSFES